MSISNEHFRESWIAQTLATIPAGYKVLDAGAGELRNRRFCSHLNYTSQDFCQYKGKFGGAPSAGLQNAEWDTSQIDIVGDIAAIDSADASFDVILCSEVFEHLPDPLLALNEFSRLLRPGGTLIITAPFASLVHMAPYHFFSGFSRYWYEYHLPLRDFEIKELNANGDWFSLLRQEITRLGGVERSLANWSWPLAYVYGLLGRLYFLIRSRRNAVDLACFGWHCVAVKKDNFGGDHALTENRS